MGLLDGIRRRGIRRSLLAFGRGRPEAGRVPAPFVVGIARSGTTLLRLMLDAHRELTIPPETHFLPRLFTHFDRWAEQGGKPRWGDKSPPYAWKARRIQRALPEAHFIHLIRDGRDVALSLSEVSWGPGDVQAAATKWVEELGQARRRARRLRRGTYIEVRYEDLVADPEPQLRRIVDFVALPWDGEMLSYHRGAEARMETAMRDFHPMGGGTITAEERRRQHELVSSPPSSTRVGRWRTEMSAEDRKAFEGT